MPNTPARFLSKAVAACAAGVLSVVAAPVALGGVVATPAAPSATPHLDHVITAIRSMEQATGSDSSEGVLWSVTDGNTLPGAGTPDPAWLVRTQDCWGVTTACSSAAVQQHLLGTIRGIIGSAQTVADVSSLTKLPTDRFRQAIIDGARDGEAAGHAPTIRLMWGRTPATPVTDGLFIDSKVRQLQRDVQAAAPHAHVVVALQSNTPLLNGYSWNHSKIVAADGRVSLAMGINLWEKSYLQSDNPVTDVGAVVQGPAAAGAERFLDVLWRSICRHPGKSTHYWNTVVPAGGGPGGCPATMTPDPVPGTGSVRVLAVGRAGYIKDGRVTGRSDWFIPSSSDRSDSGCTVPPLPNPMNGNAQWDGNNPSDTALRALVESAKSRIVIGQQEFVFPCLRDPSYDLRLTDAVARKVADGVRVRVVISNAGGAINSTETYSAEPALTQQVIMKRLVRITGSQAKADAAACKWLVVAPFRYSDNATWPDGNPPALHGKVIAVDDAAFYIGSQNAYPNQLPEFGDIIEDPVAMHDFRRDYLEPMLKYSRRAALPCAAG
jgi:phosphatidylserine/phosphatidylglycerophosphate/cardiolipin synthase-like enzyme